MSNSTRNIYIQSAIETHIYPAIGWQLKVLNTGYIKINELNESIHIFNIKTYKATGWITADVCIQKDGKNSPIETWKWERKYWKTPYELIIKTVNIYKTKAGV